MIDSIPGVWLSSLKWTRQVRLDGPADERVAGVGEIERVTGRKP